MRIPTADKLMEEAKARKMQRIADAKREYLDEVRHIRWLRARFPVDGAQTNHLVGGKLISADSNRAGGLLAAIKTAVLVLPQFTAMDIAAWLKKQRPEIDVTGRQVTIASNLSRLTRKGLLETVHRGARGRLQVYKANESLANGNGHADEKPKIKRLSL